MSTQPILPGAVLGVVGSGQLGRMFTQAAQRKGYAVHVYSDDPHAPTAQIANQVTVGAYDDVACMRAFASTVDVITYEMEDLPLEAMRAANEHAPVCPSPDFLAISQHRIVEKTTLRDAGFPVADFVPVYTREDLDAGLQQLGTPAILKTATSGYDGKGQARINALAEADAAWKSTMHEARILEACIPFEKEISVVAARGADGEVRCFDAVENQHVNHILDVSLCPAQVSETLRERAAAMTHRLMTTLEVVGVICVEFFVTREGALLINELAPRPHNSGHFTLDACKTTQFEQQVRAICGLPLGSPELWQPVAMVNILGDAWQQGEPRWQAVLAEPNACLHLYGKAAARVGRKMGHYTVTADSVQEAADRALALRAQLVVPSTSAASAPHGVYAEAGVQI